MNPIIVMLFLGAMALPAFAQAGVCEDAYNSCISGCCYDCGSTLTTDADGGLACEIGTEENPDQQCIDMCLPCSDQYKGCMEAYGGSSGQGYSDSGASCCGSAMILAAVLGFASVRMG
jgi:hypothetical protein